MVPKSGANLRQRLQFCDKPPLHATLSDVAYPPIPVIASGRQAYAFDPSASPVAKTSSKRQIDAR
jgi:hypothetical protein